MRRNIPVFALVALGLPLALSACTPTQVVQVPTVEVREVFLKSLTLPGIFGGSPVANITLNLDVTNPNAVPLKIANIAGNLIIDGADVGALSLPNVDLPARGVANQLAEVSIPVTLNTAASFLKVARGQKVTYRLDGKFLADLGPLGLQSFGPYTLSQGQWQQKGFLP